MRRFLLICIFVLALCGCRSESTNDGLITQVISQEELTEAHKRTISLLHNFQDPGSLEWVERVTEAYTEKNPEVIFDVFAVSQFRQMNMIKYYKKNMLPVLCQISTL